ncbi:MAG: MFS transporter [Thermoguttaceae bacterium]|jgi:MFS family permease
MSVLNTDAVVRSIPLARNRDSLSEGSPVPEPRGDRKEPRTNRNVHFWFAVIFLIYTVDWADRSLVSAVLPSVKEEFGLSDAKAGLMSGTLFVGLGLLALPTGMLVDRFSRKYMIVIMTSIWSAATWATGLASSYTGLLLSRLGVGAGEAGYNPAGYALIAAWYPERLRGTMVGIFNIAQLLGGGLGIAVAGWFTYHYGWRSAFGVMAVPGFVLALLMLFAPDYKTVRLGARDSREVKAGPKETLRFILTNRTLLLIFLVQMPVSYYIYAVSVWGITLCMRAYHITLTNSAWLIGLITLLATMGPLTSGWLSDRLTRKNPAGRITVAMIFLALPLVFHSIMFLGPSFGASAGVGLIAASLAQFCLAGQWGTLVAAGLDLVPPHYRGTCQSFFPLFQSLSAVWAGSATGYLSDLFGLSIALEITLVVSIGTGLILLWLARRNYLIDYERQKAIGSFAVETGV